MKLRCSMGSPFARKAAIAVHALGLSDRVELIDHDMDKNGEVRSINPLHKIPMLVTDDNIALYDSPVILDYLDDLAGGGKIFPRSGIERYKTFTRLALADGISEAAVLIHYEDRWREPAQRVPAWIAHQQSKIERAMKLFEADLPVSFDAAAMGLFCALWFNGRRTDWDWRPLSPPLTAWYDKVSASEPSIAATERKK